MRKLLLVLLTVVAAGCNRKKVAVGPTLPTITTRPEPAQAPVKRSTPPRRVQSGNRPALEATIPPTLEAVRTPEEIREAAARLRASVERAEANLATLRRRQLSTDDSRDLERVDSFLRQARAAEQAKDVLTARQYAQRAEVLSDDLLRR